MKVHQQPMQKRCKAVQTKKMTYKVKTSPLKRLKRQKLKLQMTKFKKNPHAKANPEQFVLTSTAEALVCDAEAL